MKKYLSIIVLILIVSSCNLFKKNDSEPITSIVENVEKIVQTQDNTVLKSIEKKSFGDIASSSNVAIDSINLYIDELREFEVNDDYSSLKNNALHYIIGLKDIVKSMQLYSTLSDSITTVDAKSIDIENSKSVTAVTETHNKYQLTLDKLH